MLPFFFIHLQTYSWLHSFCIKLGFNSNEYNNKTIYKFHKLSLEMCDSVFQVVIANYFRLNSDRGISGNGWRGPEAVNFLDKAGSINTSQAVLNPRRLR